MKLAGASVGVLSNTIRDVDSTPGKVLRQHHISVNATPGKDWMQHKEWCQCYTMKSVNATP